MKPKQNLAEGQLRFCFATIIALSILLFSAPGHAFAQSCCPATPNSSTTIIGTGGSSARYSEGDLIELGNGDILAAMSRFDGEHDFCYAKIVMRTSTDDGQTWSTESTIIEPENSDLEDPIEPFNVMSPSFLYSDDGSSLYMFFMAKYAWDQSDSLTPPCQSNSYILNTWGPNRNAEFYNRIFWMESTNDGSTWSNPEEISSTDGYNVMNNARAIRLSDETIALPIAISSDVAASGNNTTHYFRSYIIYSEDEGSTWDISDEVSNTSIVRGLMEPAIIEIGDSVLMLMRTKVDEFYHSNIDASDMSTSWGYTSGIAYRASTFETPQAPCTIKRIPCTEDLVIIFNDETNNGDVRNRLVSMISTDEGLTWGQEQELEYDSGASPTTWSYTSILFKDGDMLRTYYEKDTYLSLRYRLNSVSHFYDEPTTANAGSDFVDACTTQVTLAANTPTVGGGYWTIISGTGGSVSGIADPDATFTGNQGTVYVLQWNIKNGPCTSSDQVTVDLRCPGSHRKTNGPAPGILIRNHPVRDFLQLELGRLYPSGMDLRIYDALGRKRLEQGFSGRSDLLKLDLTGDEWTNGQYFIEIHDKEGGISKTKQFWILK